MTAEEMDKNGRPTKATPALGVGQSGWVRLPSSALAVELATCDFNGSG